MQRRREISERFKEKVKVMESGCHEWQSTLHRDGYGKMWVDGHQVQAHRAAWMIFKGAIPADRWVLHKCDNRQCVNLDHLYLGTPSDNAKDKVNRFSGMWGRMKFTPEEIQEAFRLRSTGLSQQAIADKTGMDQTTVSRILRRVGLTSKRVN